MQRYKILNSNRIKIIAILAMTIDHIAWAAFPGYSKAFLPTMMHICFVAEGYYHTKNIRKYTFRLFAFAILSHFAYLFASADFTDWKSFIPFYDGNILNQTSVMWSLK